MGIYAETSFTVICENKTVAKKVLKVLEALTKKSDTNGNTFGLNMKVYDNQVEGTESSQRYQNLEFRCEGMWLAIKDIKGVLEFDCPFMVEGDGQYFTNEKYGE